MEKLKLTSIKNIHEDSIKLIIEVERNNIAEDIYNAVVVRIADEIKKDVIKKVKKEMMVDKRLTKDIQEEIKQRLIEKMLPKEVKE